MLEKSAWPFGPLAGALLGGTIGALAFGEEGPAELSKGKLEVRGRLEGLETTQWWVGKWFPDWLEANEKRGRSSEGLRPLFELWVNVKTS